MQYDNICLLAEVAPDKESIERLHVQGMQEESDASEEERVKPIKQVSFFQFPDEGAKRGISNGDEASVKSFMSRGGTYKSSGSARSMSSKQSKPSRKPMHDALYENKLPKAAKVGHKPDYRSGRGRPHKI